MCVEFLNNLSKFQNLLYEFIMFYFLIKKMIEYRIDYENCETSILIP